MEVMKHEYTEYRGYTIQQRIDVKMHSAIIYLGEEIVKCIVGDILLDGSENSIEKAKGYIDEMVDK
jgi:hypothetical protein